jgi:hypothetical protein
MLPWDYAVPPVLYKYLPPERLHVLSDCRVRFSQRTVFEDDHELSPDYDRFGTETEIWQFIRDYNIDLHAAVPPELRQIVPVTLLVRRLADGDQYQQRMIDVANRAMVNRDKLGILCLTEEADSDRMWSEYADRAKGFVLSFDTSSVGFKSLTKQPGRFGKVSYDDKIIGTMLSIANFEGLSSVIFRKRLKYAFEKEWRVIRMLHRLEPTAGDVFLSPFDPESLREIRIRPECAVEESLRRLVVTDLRYQHVPINIVESKTSRV